MREFYGSWVARLDDVQFDAMSQEGRIDFLLFKNHLLHELKQLDLQEKTMEGEAALLPFARAIVSLEEARRRMDPVNPSKDAAILDGVHKEIETARKSVEAGLGPQPRPGAIIVKKTVANRAALTIGDLRKALKVWFDFYNGYDPAFTWWMAEPYKAVDHALEAYGTFLREKVVGTQPGDETTIIGDPVGREALLSELNHEMIPYTPEELIAIANREFAWSEIEMKRASRELGYGDDWHQALGRVKNMYVEPGQQPEMVRKLMVEAIAFVHQHDLVTVPPLAVETLRLQMMSPERQLINPFFTGGEALTISYPTPSMSQEQKLMSMRGNNIPFSRATVFHEMIPGHHLQGFMEARYRPYRRIFDTPFWVEGYAFYWEMLFWDLNFPRTPEERIGMLFWRMHRAARIIFSLSFHLEKMTPEECVDFLVNRVGHERDNAAAEVRRSFEDNYAPLYQCAYMLGGLELRALHHELVDSGKMTNRAFHDAVFKENSIPIEMVRAGLIKEPLSRDFKTHWKFYNPEPRSAEGSPLKQ